MTVHDRKIVDAFIVYAREVKHVQRKYFGKFIVTRRLYDLLIEYIATREYDFPLQPLEGPLRMCGIDVEVDEEPYPTLDAA